MKQQPAKGEGVETWRGGAHISHGVGDGNMATVTGWNWSCSGGETECAYSSLTLDR
jgi:hypothetical protein